MPPAGYRPQPRLIPGSARVRFVAEDSSGSTTEFDFTALPLAPALQTAFAESFAARVGPGGSLRSLGSAQQNFGLLRRFASYLASLARPPADVADLSAAHLQGWALSRGNAARELAVLKANLRRIPGLNAEFVACLAERNPPRRSTPRTSYSREEFQRIIAAARGDARRAARRIRGSGWCAGSWSSPTSTRGTGDRRMWTNGPSR